MQISINVGNVHKTPEFKRGFVAQVKARVCHASIKNCFTVLIIFLILLFVLYACKAYTSAVLLWLEKQDAIIIYVVIIMLFTIVSFPVSIGYIVIVIAAGYLFGIVLGLILSVIGANLGLLIAHNALKVVGHHSFIRSYISTETAAAIFRVIAGPASFKIVFCARLTPIPFGLQNGIFALSNISGTVYHVASLLGLFPGQVVGIYVGSSLRSMQDVLDDQHISTFTYVFAAGQLVFAAGLLVWLGSKARTELARAIAEADNKFSVPDKASRTVAFDIV